MTDRKTKAGPPARRRPDWEAIERDYRTGQFTLRELEAKHHASPAAISRRAAKERWTKDLRDVVKQATSAALITELAATHATGAQQDATAVVLAAAEAHKQVILQHRKDIGETRALAMELLGEIRVATQSRADLEALVRMASEGVSAEDAKTLREALSDMVRVHSRVTSVQRLADALTKLQALERRAFDIDGDAGKPPPGPRPVETWTDDELVADIMARRAVRNAKASSEAAA